MSKKERHIGRSLREIMELSVGNDPRVVPLHQGAGDEKETAHSAQTGKMGNRMFGHIVYSNML